MPTLLANGLIEVVPGLMIWTLIAFGITFWVLKRFAFGPIQKTIDERRDRIRAAVDEADKAREEARELLEQLRQLIADAKGEAAGILADARKVGDAQIERVKSESEVDRQRRLEDTRKQIEAETSRALDQIRTEVADLTLAATSRVVGRVLTALNDGWEGAVPNDTLLRAAPSYSLLAGGGGRREGIVYGYDRRNARLIAIDKGDGHYIAQYRLAGDAG